MANQYKKISGSEWGAWIDTGYGRKAIPKPKAGDTVIVTTKAGERHERIVRAIIKDYASGVVVALESDEAIAERAAERYAAAKQGNTEGSKGGATKAQPLTRQQISALFDKAENLRDYPGDYFAALAKAEEALAQWEKQNPVAAEEEKRESLLAEADSMDAKAANALTYDADGWLDAAAQQSRANQYKQQAQKLRQEAAKCVAQ